MKKVMDTIRKMRLNQRKGRTRGTSHYASRVRRSGRELEACDIHGLIESCLRVAGVERTELPVQAVARLEKAAAGDRDRLLLLLGATRQIATTSGASQIKEEHVERAVRTLGDASEVAADRFTTGERSSTTGAEKPIRAWDVLTRPSDARVVARAQRERRRRRLRSMAVIGAICILGGTAMAAATLFEIPQTMAIAAVEVGRHVTGSSHTDRSAARLETAAATQPGRAAISSGPFEARTAPAGPQPVLVLVEDDPPSTMVLEHTPSGAPPARTGLRGDASDRMLFAPLSAVLAQTPIVPFSSSETPTSSAVAPAGLTVAPGPTIQTAPSNYGPKPQPPSVPEYINVANAGAVRADFEGSSAQPQPTACRNRSREIGMLTCRNSRRHKH